MKFHLLQSTGASVTFNLFMYSPRHIRKVGPKTQDFWWNSRPETRDPSCGRDRGPNTRDPKGEKRDQRPETHLIGETQNPRPRTL